MNRKQMPWSIKQSIAQRVADGEWTVSEAAEAVGYSEQSIRRWVDAAQAVMVVDDPAEETDASAEASLSKSEPEVFEPALAGTHRELLDGILLKRPHLRRRSLQEYLRRHHGLELPRRVLSSYLREKGLVGAGPVGVGDRAPRRFEAASPLDLVQVDLFYVRRQAGGFWYGLSVLDDHSRLALAVPVLEEMTGEVVLSAFRGAIEGWRPPARVLTDRGPQFVSWRGRTDFQDYVEDELWATHVVAGRQHPQTLGKVERFHGTLRKEALVEAEGYASREEVQRILDHYLAYYNHVRPHQALGGLTPAERFYGMERPLRESMGTGWQPGRGLYVALNLDGRRLVIAGEGPERVRVLWDEDRPSGGKSVDGASEHGVEMPPPNPTAIS